MMHDRLVEVVRSYQYGCDRADGCDHSGIGLHRSWCEGYAISIAIHVALDATVGDDVGPLATQHGVAVVFGTMGRCDLYRLMLLHGLRAASITFIQPITAK